MTTPTDPAAGDDSLSTPPSETAADTVPETVPAAPVLETVPADATVTAPYAPAAYPPPWQAGPDAAPGDASARDPRPKGLAITALVLAIVGAVLALTGFVPFVGIVTAIVGGVVLAAALVLSIVVLAGKRLGGKGMGIAALIVSVVGGIACVFALVMSLIWFGLMANLTGDGSTAGPGPTAIVPSGTPAQPSQAGAAGSYDEQAFIDAVRPQIRSLFHEIEPGATDAQIDSVFSDDTLVLVGQSILASYETLGDDAIGVQAKAMVTSSGNTLTQIQAEHLVEAFLGAAQDHLAD